MLVNMKKMLEKASLEKYAIAHFNINNLEWAKLILETCQSQQTPVILGVSEGAAKYMGGFKTVSNLVNGLLIDLSITIPVALHLDHGSSYESCISAIDAGFSSVMIDASRYSLEENIEITSKVVMYAHERNVSVEAEIGAIGGEEDGISSNLAYAKVDDAITLAKRTNIDALAPALGSVHGLYKGNPNLDFERMQQIYEQTKLPLVLHGGSGIPDDLIKKAINCGISKININTELQISWAKGVREYLLKNDNVYDPRKIIKSGEENIRETIISKLNLFKSSRRT